MSSGTYGNLLDYVSWRGDLPIDRYPMNEVDWMLFARLAYSPFTWIYLDEEKDFLPISEIAATILRREEIHGYFRKDEDFLLYKMLQTSIRYENMKIGGFTDVFDAGRDLQFCAFIVEVEPKLYAIVYRGTDDTMVGVKEDLNMIFQCPVEAQTLALRFFNEFAHANEGKFVLCGHSKGGNLASYAASFCDYELQDRILDVYNFDGPGFDDMVLVTPQYQNICSRIHTFVPQASMIGILLGHLETHTVIHSNAQQMPGQHNMYTWEIQKDHFHYEEETTKESRYFDRTMAEWLKQVDKKQREAFIEAVYEIVTRLNIQNFSDLKKNWLGNSVALFQLLGSIEEDDRKVIGEGFSILMKSAWDNIDLKGTFLGNMPGMPQKESEFVDEDEGGTEIKPFYAIWKFLPGKHQNEKNIPGPEGLPDKKPGLIGMSGQNQKSLADEQPKEKADSKEDEQPKEKADSKEDEQPKEKADSKEDEQPRAEEGIKTDE